MAYLDQLSGDAKDKYYEKVQLINNTDPYTLPFEDMSADPLDFPKIAYIDICNYLVFERSTYTYEEFKCYKSLEAYNQYVSGWVENILVQKFPDCSLLKATVLHSQRLRNNPLSPWVIAKPTGCIIRAHCDCVAGLGETCTHVGALLFCVDGINNALEERTVTDVKAYWKLPSSSTAGPPDAVENIDFTSATKLYKASKNEIVVTTRSQENSKNIPFSTPDVLNGFLAELASKDELSVLHTIVRPFADELAAIKEPVQNILAALHQQKFEVLSLCQLVEHGKNVELNLTQEECAEIEKNTQMQSGSPLWFDVRLGRITASKFKQSVRTKIENPAMSLVEAICYPRKKAFKTKATTYGCEHEDHGVASFLEQLSRTHKDVQAHKVGFMINIQFPHVGASPDGIISCSCCSPRVLEVKCPYCARDDGIAETDLKKLCLNKCENEYYLPQDHQYYHQVQMQLAVTEIKTAYFVMWSKKDLYVEEISFDPKFWEDNLPKATDFFQKVILPELLGRYYTRRQRSLNHLTTTAPVLFCICRKENDGSTLIECDAGGCDIRWFHPKCVGLTEQMKEDETFYCNDCMRKMPIVAE